VTTVGDRHCFAIELATEEEQVAYIGVRIWLGGLTLGKLANPVYLWNLLALLEGTLDDSEQLRRADLVGVDSGEAFQKLFGLEDTELLRLGSTEALDEYVIYRFYEQDAVRFLWMHGVNGEVNGASIPATTFEAVVRKLREVYVERWGEPSFPNPT